MAKDEESEEEETTDKRTTKLIVEMPKSLEREIREWADSQQMLRTEFIRHCMRDVVAGKLVYVPEGRFVYRGEDGEIAYLDEDGEPIVDDDEDAEEAD